jgi:hypothetical protein
VDQVPGSDITGEYCVIVNLGMSDAQGICGSIRVFLDSMQF